MTAAHSILQDVLATIDDAPAERRGVLLRHVTDLFIVGADRYSEEDVALFDDVFRRLVSEIERSARALLALRLAPIANSPPGIICTLAFDDAIEVAGPVLSQSPRISDPTLARNAKIKGQEHLLAISRRSSLSTLITDILVERGDRQVVLSTVNNRGARFSETGFDRLIERSQDDDQLAIRIAAREDVPPPLFNRLLQKASLHVRAKLMAEYPHARGQVHQAVADAVDLLQIRASGSHDPAVMAWISRLHKCGLLNDDKVRSFAKNDQFEEVVAALAVMSELTVPAIAGFMAKPEAKALLVVARAVGLSWATVDAVLELRRKKHPQLNADVSHLLAKYERVQRETAQGYLKSLAARLKSPQADAASRRVD